MVVINANKFDLRSISSIISIIIAVIIGPTIAIQTMKSDIKVLSKQIEDKSTADNQRFSAIETGLSEIRVLHYQVAARQAEHDKSISGLTRTSQVNSAVLAKVLPEAVAIEKSRSTISTQTLITKDLKSLKKKK